MNFVKSFDLLGVEATQISSITGKGAPKNTTEGAIGTIYMDTDTNKLYKCTKVSGSSYTWVEIAPQANWTQTNENAPDYIKNKEEVVAALEFRKRIITNTDFLSKARENNANIESEIITINTAITFEIEFNCFPTEIAILEFYGYSENVSYFDTNGNVSELGAMFNVKFYDNSGEVIEIDPSVVNTKEGGTYKTYILGQNKNNLGYHKYGFIAPYGAIKGKLIFSNSSNNECIIKNIKLTVHSEVNQRARLGILYDAHLGMVFSAPRNTMPGFELAKKAGFTSCITNCNWTNDGVLVALHNDTIKETSNGIGNVHNMTYNELLTYDFGSWYNPVYTGTKIPKLEEVVQLMSISGIIPIFRLHNAWKPTNTEGEIDETGAATFDDATLTYLNKIHSWIIKYGLKGRACVKVQSTKQLKAVYTIFGEDVNYITYEGFFGSSKEEKGNPGGYLKRIETFPGQKLTIEVNGGYLLSQYNNEDYKDAETGEKHNIVSLIKNYKINKNIEVSAYTLQDSRLMRELMLMGVNRFCSDMYSDIIFPLDEDDEEL